FEQIVADFGPMVLRVCRAVLGPDEAEDAWSETFLAALRAYPQLDEGANVEAWLVTIAHRKAIDATRAAARRPVAAGALPAPAAGRTGGATGGRRGPRCRQGSAPPWPTTTWPGCRTRRSPRSPAVALTRPAGPPPTGSRRCAPPTWRARGKERADDGHDGAG